MKDFAGTEIKAGAIVVVKPSARTSFMRFGFVKKDPKKQAHVISFGRTSWYSTEPEVISGLFQSTSMYVLKGMGRTSPLSYVFPEGFPKELKELYYEQFPRNSA